MNIFLVHNAIIWYSVSKKTN